MEGPYRDLGEGFARLTGVEGARRGPSRVNCVEDVLLELLRNARDAGASHVFVATSLKGRRYRTLTVLDDGAGIPEAYTDLIFEPGVTSRHLDPALDPPSGVEPRAIPYGVPHGAGLSLYHIRNFSLDARVFSASTPTSMGVTIDTHLLPERALQSSSRPSKTNILATLQDFARANPDLPLYYGSPPQILATLLDNHIIPRLDTTGAKEVRDRARGLGLRMSVRTVQRIVRGEVRPVSRVSWEVGLGSKERRARRAERAGPVLWVGEEERARIEDILTRAARAGYLEIEDLGVETRPGEVIVRARVYEPEDEYE
ncbi:MAG TPA: ATP-binding protein [Rubrobacteraceae bacterium]|nr:ATP-binding protein [Rubrobacteraceae bacterium]